MKDESFGDIGEDGTKISVLADRCTNVQPKIILIVNDYGCKPAQESRDIVCVMQMYVSRCPSS